MCFYPFFSVNLNEVLVYIIITIIIKRNTTVKTLYVSIKNLRQHYFSNWTTEDLYSVVNNFNKAKNKLKLHFITKNPILSKHD